MSVRAFFQGARGQSAPAQHQGVPHLRRLPLHRGARSHSAGHSPAPRLCEPSEVLLQRYRLARRSFTLFDYICLIRTIANKRMKPKGVVQGSSPSEIENDWINSACCVNRNIS